MLKINKKILNIFFSFLVLTPLLLTMGSLTMAQSPQATPVVQNTTGLDVTNVFQVTDKAIENGDIVRNADKGITRSSIEYDDKIFGIYQQNPLIVFKNVDGTGLPIARNGTALLNVSTLNGTIKKGDLITSSPIAGKGQKATRSGYVVGQALEDFEGKEGQKTSVEGKSATLGQIQVALRIEFAEIDKAKNANRLFQYLDAALFSSVRNPEQFIRMIRYTGSVFVLVSTAIFAYLVFAKTVTNSIQAIGRNPLAKKSIQAAIILNIIFSSVVIILGIIASFVILRA